MRQKNGVVKICICGTSFYVKKSHAHRRRYCNKKCGYEYRSMPTKRGEYVIKNPRGKTGANTRHYLYKGEKAEYATVHQWVYRHKEDPKKCEHCGASDKKLQWANKSHEYKRDLDDWLRLCISCHRKHDLDENGNKRNDTKKYGVSGFDRKNGKLTNDQIKEIFVSTENQVELAKKFGVNQNYISRIQLRIRCARITKGLVQPQRKPHNHILTPPLVLEIFNLSLEQKKIAEMYGVSEMTISGIKTGRNWSHITGKKYAA